MTTIFYILLFVTAHCCGFGGMNNTIVTDGTWYGMQDCHESCSVKMEIANEKAINEIVAERNEGISRLHGPDLIYKVTLENGVFTQREIRIVPIKRIVEETVKQQREVIEGWKVEEK
jgi:hypothetical protein